MAYQPARRSGNHVLVGSRREIQWGVGEGCADWTRGTCVDYPWDGQCSGTVPIVVLLCCYIRVCDGLPYSTLCAIAMLETGRME